MNREQLEEIRPEVSDALLSYFAERDRQRAAAINRILITLRPYERRLVREAAVMGYVRGYLAAGGRDRVPDDPVILSDVLGACIAMDYPYIEAASNGRRRRVTASRKWPGEDGWLSTSTTAEGSAEGGNPKGSSKEVKPYACPGCGTRYRTPEHAAGCADDHVPTEGGAHP